MHVKPILNGQTCRVFSADKWTQFSECLGWCIYLVLKMLEFYTSAFTHYIIQILKYVKNTWANMELMGTHRRLATHPCYGRSRRRPASGGNRARGRKHAVNQGVFYLNKEVLCKLGLCQCVATGGNKKIHSNTKIMEKKVLLLAYWMHVGYASMWGSITYKCYVLAFYLVNAANKINCPCWVLHSEL